MLTDDSVVHDIYFFDGDTGEQTLIYHAEDIMDADNRNDKLNVAMGYK